MYTLWCVPVGPVIDAVYIRSIRLNCIDSIFKAKNHLT